MHHLIHTSISRKQAWALDVVSECSTPSGVEEPPKTIPMEEKEKPQSQSLIDRHFNTASAAGPKYRRPSYAKSKIKGKFER